jgi:4-azaleucine resistance transporter AzlC
VKKVLSYAAAVMASYVVIGLACGMLEAQAGMAPWMAAVLSVVLYSGAGQFMMANLLLAGSAPGAVAATCAFINMRQILYAAALAPHAKSWRLRDALAFAATVTDESFGVVIERLEHDSTWTARQSVALNWLCMGSWTAANFAGCALGAVLAVPTELASFAMTAIFICLLVAQLTSSTYALVAAVAAAGVAACKLAGLTQITIVAGAVLGILAGALATSRSTAAPAEKGGE